MAPREKLTDAEKELLTDEERAGYEDDSLVDEGEDQARDPEEGDAAAVTTDKQKPKEEEEEPKKPDEKAVEDGEAADGADPEKPAAEPADDGKLVERRPAPDERVLPDWKAPENARTRLSEIETALDELATQFDEGELSATEYRQKQRELEKEHRDLDWAIRKAEIAEESAADRIERTKAQWYDGVVPEFLKQHPEYESPAFMGALDAMVKQLQVQQPDNQFDPEILVRADAAVRTAFGLPPRDGKPQQQPGQRTLPPSLAHVPAADVTDPAADSEFAQIDRLEGEQFEAALARLSDEQRDRYLASR